MAGLAAATAHRGVRHVRIPTTTLSQCDAGVGVKNGINAFGKKNFIGTFAPPYAVINDFQMLASLPDRDKRAGGAEAVKVALIRDGAFFEQIERDAARLAAFEPEAMQGMIRRCAELHLDHIASGGDPFETGPARPLDFGHWAAHKLEQLSGYGIRHGEAVAAGMALDVIYSRQAGLLGAAAAERALALLEALGFALFANEMLHLDSNEQPALLQGLEEFREHLGGELSLTMLRGHWPARCKFTKSACPKCRTPSTPCSATPGAAQNPARLAPSKSARETHGRHQRGRADPVAHRAGHAAPGAIPRAGRRRLGGPGLSGGHLHGAIQLLDRHDPARHGIVANGWYDRDLAEVHFWRQSNHLVAAPKIWEQLRQADSAFHLRAVVLVAQHVFDARIIPSRRARFIPPTGARFSTFMPGLTAHPRRDQARFGGVPFRGVLGAGSGRLLPARRRGRGDALDCRVGQMDRKEIRAHAEPDLPAALGLQFAAARPGGGPNRRVGRFGAN